MTTLRVGMGDRYAIRITVLASADFDPSTVTGATFRVTKPGGATDAVSWVGTVESQDATQAVAKYVFSASGLDLDKAGVWTAWIQWTEPGFTIGPRSEVAPFTVAPSNKV